MLMEYNYNEKELKNRKRLIKFFRGTHERFKKPENFEQNSKDFMNALFDSCSFEDEQMIRTVIIAHYDLKQTLSTTIGKDNYEFYKFLKIVDNFFRCEYNTIIERFYR